MPASTPSPAELREAHCWFDVDRVPKDEASTAWKRRARWGQAKWRAARDYRIGAEPYDGGPDATPVGSRLALDFARDSHANFISKDVVAAVKHRLEHTEPHETLRKDRLWADLLSSMPLCFNLFGALHAQPEAAAAALKAWWPDAPSGQVQVRFEHSPGRRDPLFLNNRSAFDVAFEVAGDKAAVVIGVETKYHEHAKREDEPNEGALERYIQVTERSEVFAEGWRARLVGTDLQQIWLDHLLVLAMLQHPSKRWTWGRFVLVFPAGNPSISSAASRYREVLRDRTTFEARTIEDLIGTQGALEPATVDALRERYELE